MIGNFKLLRGGADRPRLRKTARTSATTAYLETSRLVATLIFVATVAVIVVISFVGVSTSSVPVLPNQQATVRIVASAPFTFESAERTRMMRDQIRDRIPPVFRLEFEPYRQFEAHMRDLLVRLDEFSREHPPGSPFTATRETDLDVLVEEFNNRGPYRVSTEDVATLLSAGNAEQRFAWIENGLVALREIYSQGVHDGSVFQSASDGSGVMVFQIAREGGGVSQQAVESMEEALTLLRINLAAEGVGRELSLALFRIFRNGVTPNLIYDQEATQIRQAEALKSLKPVIVRVDRGQTIIEPGTRVTPEQYEMLVAHREYLLANGGVALNEGLQLFGRILLVLAMVIACVFYIRMEDAETFRSNSRLGLLALVVIVNLALVRTVFSLGDLPFFIENSSAGSILPYLAPTALAPLIVAILLDTGSAVFMSLLISIFTGVIYGNRLDLLVLTFLASIVGISASRLTRKRGNVVRAALLAGVTVSVFALLIGVVDRLPPVTVLTQMGAGLAMGLVTGVAVVGALPLLESLFKRTTDITLLELTDFNHPLLRLMQMESPGTYHHSLVVAQLAENAANAINANPLLARVCALYHDIGKTTKPEYFTENQRDCANPHDFNNPSLSALIIKSHVKEGVDLALKHRLPRAVIDVIQQHHGTSLIRYFFQRALNGLRTAPGPGSANPFLTHIDRPADPAGTAGPGPVPVSETTYRYDGPKPQFKESAIIHLADSVEAASRSIRKVTAPHLSELIDQIFHERMEDGQLDECPLTFQEIGKIKSSFTFTLLNMLHGRVAYPAEPAADRPAPRLAEK